MEHSAILLTCIKGKSVLKTILVFFLSGRLRQVLLYIQVNIPVSLCGTLWYILKTNRTEIMVLAMVDICCIGIL